MELECENWRLCSTTLVRGVSGELEDENSESSLAAALVPLQLSHVSRPPGSLERLTHTQRPTHCLNLLGDTHTDRDSYTHKHRYTHTETHTLPQLTRLNT